MSPAGDREASTAAAIAELRTEMKYLREDLAEVKQKLETLNKARWLGSGVLLAIGGGSLYGLQKLALLLPILGK